MLVSSSLAHKQLPSDLVMQSGREFFIFYFIFLAHRIFFSWCFLSCFLFILLLLFIILFLLNYLYAVYYLYHIPRYYINLTLQYSDRMGRSGGKLNIYSFFRYSSGFHAPPLPPTVPHYTFVFVWFILIFCLFFILTVSI